MLWPAESLPFTEGGMVPDILFNPHGYPSRMTIGMMIETMAGTLLRLQTQSFCLKCAPKCKLNYPRASLLPLNKALKLNFTVLYIETKTTAGKACAVHGIGQDSTPFLFSEENRADAHVGEMLKQAGKRHAPPHQLEWL